MVTEVRGALEQARRGSPLSDRAAWVHRRSGGREGGGRGASFQALSSAPSLPSYHTRADGVDGAA